MTPLTPTEDPLTILITGVSSGLGKAMAEEALARGHVVIGTVRRQEDLDAFEAAAPGRAVGRLLDLSDTSRIAEVVHSVEADVGPIDVLVNNAGYGLAGMIEELDLDDLRRELDVDVVAQVAFVQAVLPGMRARRRGHILNVVSMGAVITFPANGAYHAAKFAMLGITDTLAKEVRPLGVKVTSLMPGLYDTDWGGRSRAQSALRIDDYAPQYAGMEAPEMSGDPARLAIVVMDLLNTAEPPVRLLVGHSAVGMIREEMHHQVEEIELWERTSDTDGDG